VLKQNATVLAIEDDPEISGILEVRLANEGYEVHLARCGKSGVKAFYEHRPDLVLLDVGLPEYDGFEVLNRIRELSEVPVIFISAGGGEEDRVRGLTGGGDDYIVKPFGGRELVARIEAVMRRSSTKTSGESNTYIDDRVNIGVRFARSECRWARYPTHCIRISTAESARVTSEPGAQSKQLLDLVWGTDAMEAALSSVRLYVGYLRAKIEQDRAMPNMIETV